MTRHMKYFPTPKESFVRLLLLAKTKEDLHSAFECLTDRERSVLKLRHSIHSGKLLSLRKTGETMNLSTERIRQIEAKALMKMLHHLTEKRMNRQT